MSILNMIAQGGGGSNVGEPTNLSAIATSNSSIDIKWTDNNLQALPPSTFQKSVLVRKVGSAPTTPSDGTTVVTETVMNTYQSSAYSDTGLTEGTTYYYQVFSYSTDGGITYGTPVSANPLTPWQPGVNTIAYYPLDSTNTVDDLSGNNLTLTGIGTYQFGVYGGIDCCSISGANTQLSVSYSGSGDTTILAWSNYQDEPIYDTGVIAMTGISGHPVWQIGYNKKGQRPNYDVNGGIYQYAETGGIDHSTCYQETPNQWYLVVGTWGGGIMKLYINGVLEKTTNYSLGTEDYTTLSISRDPRAMQGYVSNVIFEDKIRTAQEIADYYNLTKGNYGL